jgi:DNA-binding NtrC family response regulator
MSGYERDLIMNTLEQSRFNLMRTAEALKISRHALRYRMQRLNIHVGGETDEESGQPAAPSAAKETSAC